MVEKAHHEPSRVAAEQGEVLVDSTDGVAVGLTPEAAIETSERLLEKGMEAAEQRRLDTAPKSR